MMFINLLRGVEIDCQFCGHRHSIETECPELTLYLAELQEWSRAETADQTP